MNVVNLMQPSFHWEPDNTGQHTNSGMPNAASATWAATIGFCNCRSKSGLNFICHLSNCFWFKATCKNILNSDPSVQTTNCYPDLCLIVVKRCRLVTRTRMLPNLSRSLKSMESALISTGLTRNLGPGNISKCTAREWCIASAWPEPV